MFSIAKRLANDGFDRPQQRAVVFQLSLKAKLTTLTFSILQLIKVYILKAVFSIPAPQSYQIFSKPSKSK